MARSCEHSRKPSVSCSDNETTIRPTLPVRAGFGLGLGHYAYRMPIFQSLFCVAGIDFRIFAHHYPAAVDINFSRLVIHHAKIIQRGFPQA